MEQTVEVYQIESDRGALTDPIHVIETQATGLCAIETSSEHIFMGFSGSLASQNCVFQVYNYDYEMLKNITLDIAELNFSDMSLCHDDRFIVCSYTGSIVTVINLETDEPTIVEDPFGEVETIWATEIVPFKAEGEPQTVLMPSTRGLFLSIITEEGQFMYIMESHYPGSNVTNCVIINEDEVLCSIQDDEVSKLVILNLDTKEEKLIIQPENEIYFLDIVPIPGVSEFFIMHTGRGIQLIDAPHQKTYDLSLTEQNNFNVFRSLAV